MRPARLIARQPVSPLLQRLNHGVEIEAAGLLAGRILPESLEELPDIGLGRKEKEDMLDPPMRIVDGLMIRAFEGVAQQVEELRESERHEGILPDIEAMGALFGEDELPAPDSGRQRAVRRR